MVIQDVIFVCVSAPLAHLVELAYASRPLDASSARRHGSALSLTRLVVSPLPYCTWLSTTSAEKTTAPNGRRKSHSQSACGTNGGRSLTTGSMCPSLGLIPPSPFFRTKVPN